MVVNYTHCIAADTGLYDTYGKTDEALSKFIRNVPPGNVIAGITADEPSWLDIQFVLLAVLLE